MGRYAYRPPPRRPRESRGCLPGLATLVAAAAILGIVYAFAIRPMVSRRIADRIAGPAAPVPTLMATGAPAAPPAAGQAGAQVVERAGAALPDAVAALPPGQVVVSDADINGLIAARPEAIAPLDGASVTFAGGLARAQISAYGLSSIATVGLAAHDGRVVVTSARLDAPLSYLISGPDVAAALADRLNAELAAQGRRVDDLRIEEGHLVLVTS